MKKNLLFIVVALFALQMKAGQDQTVTLEQAGTLASIIEGDVVNLTVKGPINRSDFETMKTALQFNSLENINLGEANIVGESVMEGENLINYPQDTIPYGAFKDCNYLKSVVLPPDIVLIESHAFMGCSRLTSITIPETVTDFGVGVFELSGLTTFKFPSKTRYIGPNFFANCSDLETVDFSMCTDFDGLLNATFSSCTKLESIDLSHTKITRTEATFILCENLESIIFPTTLTAIGDRTFQRCSKLKEFTIPAHVKRIENVVFGESGLESIVIPSTLEYIGNSVFYKCLSLGSIDFSQAKNLTSVTGIRGFTYYANDGLTNACTALEEIDMTACTQIEALWFSFIDNSNLKTIKLPNSIKYVGHSAFRNCTSLNKLYINSTEPPITHAEDAEQITGVPATCTLYVPVGTKTAYSTTPIWEDFLYIEEFDPTITSIENVNLENGKIIEQQFYTLTGQCIGKNTPVNSGLYVVKNKYENGTITTIKVMIK